MTATDGQPTADPVRLIAHRGGVVDTSHPENSVSALEEAILHGYWMVETDLDESRDGHLVVHHGSFWRSFGELRSPGMLSWDQIRGLSAREDNSHPLEFREYAALCRNRMRLMIDTKGTGHRASFYEAMERTLRENQLLENAYFIGLEEAKDHFRGKARISINSTALKNADKLGADASSLYFLFGHGRDLDREAIELAGQAGVPVVASINEYHYSSCLTNHLKTAQDDMLRLCELGVRLFQIDSVYESFLKQV